MASPSSEFSSLCAELAVSSAGSGPPLAPRPDPFVDLFSTLRGCVSRNGEIASSEQRHRSVFNLQEVVTSQVHILGCNENFPSDRNSPTMKKTDPTRSLHNYEEFSELSCRVVKAQGCGVAVRKGRRVWRWVSQRITLGYFGQSVYVYCLSFSMSSFPVCWFPLSFFWCLFYPFVLALLLVF